MLEAAVGHRDESDDKKRTLERVVSGVKVVVYASLALLTLRFLLGSGSGDKTASPTADVMARSGGRWLAGLVGLAVVGRRPAMAARGLKNKHVDTARRQPHVPRLRQRVAGPLGMAGLVGRGSSSG